MTTPQETIDRLFPRGTRPRLIVPLVEATESALMKAAEQVKQTPAEVVEWRVDRFEGCRHPERVIEVAARLRAAVAPLPVLFTIRTSHEGGDWHPSSEAYRDLIADACAAGVIDLVDVQYLNPEAARCIKVAKAHGIPVVASHHDFKATPSLTALNDRLDAMAAMGADVCKVAVMPRTPADVLTVLEVTRRWALTSPLPLISMSMGPLGVLTRVSGQIFGSCATFGALGDAISAPGQLPIEELVHMMDVLGADL